MEPPGSGFALWLRSQPSRSRALKVHILYFGLRTAVRSGSSQAARLRRCNCMAALRERSATHLRPVGAWNRDGVILFNSFDRRGLYRLVVSTGEAAPVTTLDPARHEVQHLWPQFLPGRPSLHLSGAERALGEYWDLCRFPGFQRPQVDIKNQLHRCLCWIGTWDRLSTLYAGSHVDGAAFR